MVKKFDVPEPEWFGWRKYLGMAIFLIIFLVLLFNTVVIIGPGQRGVLLEFGRVTGEVYGEGLHIIIPIVHNVPIMDVRTQKYESDATAASKDLQDTYTKVALNYHLSPDNVNEIYQTLGPAYADRYISPAIQEVVKASTAKFNAEELITQRPIVKDTIEEGLKERLNSRGIIVETVSITDFQFSKQFTEAIESKVTAQQLALKAENDLKRIKIEAQQAIEKAKGESEAIRIINEELEKSPQYIEFLATQKWDGKLPLVTGDATPFIQIPTK
ncbi:MAG: prohibitin family protein [Candidatus Aenigmarchaeota archaeon]|nr:prohibitin family protein [Candidatus Aenigmarchaeota archaeon]